jgi:hypothetical protein
MASRRAKRGQGDRARGLVWAASSLIALAAPRAARADEESPSEASPAPEVAPHPRAAIDPPEAKPEAWSFSHPLAWPEATTRLDVAGYVLPQFQFVSLPSALPRDKTQFGARGSRVGFAIHGNPLEGFSYLAHIVIAPAGTDRVTLLSPTSTPALGISLPTSTGTSVEIEEAIIGYRPAQWLEMKLGAVRMPFTVAQTTPVPKQMFPLRAPQSSEFQSGADTGLLTTFAPFAGRLQIAGGVFLGGSLGGAGPNQTVRGPAFSAQVSAHPLGAMSLREGDLGRSPLRVAVGFASIYRRARLLDATGYETTAFTDARFAAWLRAHAHGVYVQGELMKRLRTDDLSGRPSVSEGAYVQASYYQPVGTKVAFGPVARAGVVTNDIGFQPRRFTSFEAGLAFFPKADQAEPEKLRILVEYLQAELSPFSELQREGLVQLQLEF